MNPQSTIASRMNHLTPQQAVFVTSELARRRKSPVVVWLLWLFLGGLGAHNLYLGRTTRGVIEIVAFVIGWATIWVAVGFAILGVLYLFVLFEAFGLPRAIRNADARAEAAVLGSLP